jgi:hypothetical protein
LSLDCGDAIGIEGEYVTVSSQTQYNDLMKTGAITNVDEKNKIVYLRSEDPVRNPLYIAKIQTALQTALKDAKIQ